MLFQKCYVVSSVEMCKRNKLGLLREIRTLLSQGLGFLIMSNSRVAFHYNYQLRTHYKVLPF